MAGDPAVSASSSTLLADLHDEWAGLDQRIEAYDDELTALTREDEQARWLATIPGICVINATALLAAIGGRRCIRRMTSIGTRLPPPNHPEQRAGNAARSRCLREVK